MIDPTKPVRLLAHVPYGTDFYHPREYQPGELPAALLVEGIVSQDKEVVVAPLMTYKDAASVQEVVVTSSDVAVTPAAFGQFPVLVNERLYVNKASVDEFSKLPGVGTATALKLVTERDKKVFEGLQDLSDRVPLPRGKWEDLQAYLLFD